MCCGRDDAEMEAARRGGRWLLAFYASTPAYRPVLEVEGWEDLQPELNKLSKSGRWEEMPNMIDDTMLAALAAVGSPKEVGGQIADRFGGLVDRVGFYTPYSVSERDAGRAGGRAGRDRRRGGGMSRPSRSGLRRVLAVRGERRRGRAAWSGPPTVRRESVEVGGGRRVSALVWGSEPAGIVLHPRRGPERPHLGHGGPGPRPTRWWPSTCPGTGTPTGPGTARRSIRGPWPRTWPPPSAGWRPTARMVVGMSLGGMTAIALAASHPELVKRLALVDITPGVDHEKSSDIAAFLAGPETFASFDEILERTIQFNPTRSESSLRRGVLHNAVQREDGTWTWRHQLGRPSDATGLHVDSLDFGALWDDLEHIHAPVLLVRGKLSPVVDDADEAEFRRRRPADRVVTVEDAGHSIQGDQPVELARILDRLLRRPLTSGPATLRRRAGRSCTPPVVASAPARPVVQRGIEHLADVGRQMEGHLLPHRLGDVLEVGAVADRQHHRGQPGPVGGQHLLADAADGQHPALQGDLTGHAQHRAHRHVAEQADQRGGHGDPGGRPVLGDGAGRHVDVEPLAGEDRRVDAQCRRRASARRRGRSPPTPS